MTQYFILETAVARLNKTGYRKPVGTELPMKQLLCVMRAASLPCPHWRPFSELSFTPVLGLFQADATLASIRFSNRPKTSGFTVTAAPIAPTHDKHYIAQWRGCHDGIQRNRTF